MMLGVSFRRAARTEFDEAVDRYEGQRAGLGRQFFAEIDRCLSMASAQPVLYEAVHADIRRITLRRFPFNIYYRAEKTRIVVLAVFHTSRDPAIWRHRI